MPAALSDKTNMDEELLDCGPKLAEGQSLQDAFARFRRERKREHKLRTPSSQLVRDAATRPYRVLAPALISAKISLALGALVSALLVAIWRAAHHD